MRRKVHRRCMAGIIDAFNEWLGKASEGLSIHHSTASHLPHSLFPDYYRTLGVTPMATFEELKAAHIQMGKIDISHAALSFTNPKYSFYSISLQL